MRLTLIKKIWNNKNLKYVAAFLITAILVFLSVQCLDNDSWFLLAEGRHITTEGIFYSDVLSMHSDLNITVQQYVFATILWLIYNTFGPIGVYVLILLFNFGICILLYKICMVISDKNVNLSLFLMIITDALLVLGGFITNRPQILDYTIFLAIILILELYIKTDKTKCLWWIPILSIVQINCHASLWFMIFVLLFVYIIDSIKNPKLYLQGYKTKPLILISIVSFLVGLLNPYGIKMITYILTSYGIGDIFNLVAEMRPFDIMTCFNISLYASIVIVLMFHIFGKNKIRIRHLLLFFGFLALGINSFRGMSHLILVMFFPLAYVYKNNRLEYLKDVPIVKNAVLVWTGVSSVGIFIILSIIALPGISTGLDSDIVAAVDAIDRSENRIENAAVYVGYNDGGYLEFRGYKSYLDPRAEVFIKANNGKEDILKEWLKFERGRMTDKELIEKYNFDYIFINDESYLFRSLNETDEYKMIYENEDCTIKVYQRVVKQ